MKYANSDKIKLYKVFADDSDTDKPYGVMSHFVDNPAADNIEWFATQEEQEREYQQAMGEISRGEWL